jgi:transcription elongation factor Elf1
MTTINSKMGLRPAGKRSFMKNLPTDRSAAAQITSAICPHCQVTGKCTASKTKGPGWLFCTWCSTSFEVSG